MQNVRWHPTFQVCKDNVRIKQFVICKHYEEKTHIGKLEGIPSDTITEAKRAELQQLDARATMKIMDADDLPPGTKVVFL